jgi:ATP-dependent helicase HepA
LKVRAAILAVLSRRPLRVAVERAGIEGVDLNDQTAMTLALNHSRLPSATALLQLMDADQLPEVLMFLGLPPTTPFEELQAMAGREDARDAEVLRAEGALGDDDEGSPGSVGEGLVDGSLVTWEPHGLIGSVERVGLRKIEVKFDDGETRFFATRDAPLRPFVFQPGDAVTRADGSMGVIQGYVAGQPVPTWKVWFGKSIANVAEIALRPAVLLDPFERMRSKDLGSASDFNLRAVAMEYWTAHRHNQLVSLSNARVDLKPYQVSVVHRVITEYPHRFLLCDEVGLGKTIEAAMIIKELRARDQARRVLILTPAGLLRQWQFELKTKFNETFSIYNKNTVRLLKDEGHVNPWSARDSVITSHVWASWTELRRKEIMAVDWDVVVIDEAHHARAQRQGTSIRRTNLFRLVEGLIANKDFLRRGALLLTATPMQLDLFELYSLVEMLNPALFVSEGDFKTHLSSLTGLSQLVERLETFGLPTDENERAEAQEQLERLLELDEETVTNLILRLPPEEIAARLRSRHRLSEVMLRNRKANVMVSQPRVAKRWEVSLSPAEEQVQRIMQKVFEEGWRLQEQTNQYAIGFLMVILQKLLASSSRALLVSLEKRRAKLGQSTSVTLTLSDAEERLEDDEEASEVASELVAGGGPESHRFDEVIGLLKGIEVDTKAQVLVKNLGELFSEHPDEKVLVFTEFRETQDMLFGLLAERWGVHKFHGQLSVEQKDSAVDAFRRGIGPQILLSTEAGGEGRNFQFCHVLVNYDLPWNPMKVEQRIGRVDRIGQEHPISIFNFHVEGTIEGRILEVLERRIKVFEEAVGTLDPILGDAENDIRKALSLAQDARDARIAEIGRLLEKEIQTAKAAEAKFADFIMDAKSYVSAIVKKATGEVQPVDEKDFERFLEKLLAWAHAWIGPESDTGERIVEFHAPFTVEHPELFGGMERRRVCLNPRSSVDSELVEYLGFGHPVIDALVRRVAEEKPDGAASVRAVESASVDVYSPGWQFNWIITVNGLRSTQTMYPLFVSDDGEVDAAAGRRLLDRSRFFPNETFSGSIDVSSLDNGHALAIEHVGRVKEELVTGARLLARERMQTELARATALFEHRSRAAQDKIASCKATLARMQASAEKSARQVIPLWEANVTRAEAELIAVSDDHQRALADIRRMSNPLGEFSLIGVARIEIVTQAETL